MRKIAIILAALMLLSVVPLASFAGPLPDYSIYPNDPVDMPKADPVIDGVINWDEGWSKPAKLDFDTVGFFWKYQPMQMNADLYFAYSDEGIYFAADVTELSFSTAHDQNKENHDFFSNCFMLSTGDGADVEGDDESESGSGTQRPAGTYNYGYNGDIITLTLDPSRVCQYGKFVYCPWYNIGIFENSEKDTGYEAKVYRSKANYGDITDRVTTAATVKEIKEYDALTMDNESAADVYGQPFMSGFVVEMFLPWDILVEDIDAITYGMSSVTKEELAEKGAEICSAVSYMDRFYDEEAGGVDNWGRWIVVCDVAEDGTLGDGSSGTDTKLNGLVLVNGEEPSIKVPFDDVKENAWYTKGVAFCNNFGYMSGTGGSSFSPNTILTRAMFCTILAKIAGVDASSYSEVQTRFADVPTGKWYSGPIAWATENGFSSGIGETAFGPNLNVTREQLATFLSTFARLNHIVGAEPADITGYDDYSDISNWALDGVKWAVGNGLISGTTPTTLAPKTNATRAQVALIVMNFVDGFGLLPKTDYKPVTEYKISPWVNAAKIPVYYVNVAQ